MPGTKKRDNILILHPKRLLLFRNFVRNHISLLSRINNQILGMYYAYV